MNITEFKTGYYARESGWTDKTRIFLNTLIITTSTILEKGIFLFINVVVARYLGLGQYGEYTTALAFATFFSMITDMGINQSMIRELNYEGEQGKTFFNIVLFKVFVSVAVFLVFLVSILFTNYNRDVIYLTVIFGFVRFIDEYIRLYNTYYEASNHYILAACYRLLFALLFLGSVFAVIYIHGGNREIAVSRLVVVLLFFGLITYSLLKGRMKEIDPAYMINFSRETIPFASIFISNNIIFQGSLIILPLLHGSIYTGIFQNAYMFLTTLMFIPASFDRVFIPYLYQQNHDDNTEKFQFSFEIIAKTYSFISFYIMTILYLYSDYIIVAIFGAKFKDSVLTLKILTIAIPFLFNAAYIMLTSLNKQDIVSRLLKYIAFASVALNLVLGYFFKVSGTAAATVLTLFCIFLISNIAVKKHTNLGISHLISGYLKGFFIFGVCWLLHGLLLIKSQAAAMLVTTIIFIWLNNIFLITNNDYRIIFEMLNIGKKKSEDIV